MADLSKIKLPSGTTYNIKDNNALPLTGGSVTGPVSFGDSVSIDDATIGSLVVDGGASFTNNIQANTINGVTVGNSPKFTDTNTEVSTLTLTSGSTAGTALTSGGKFTLTAGSKTVSFTMPTIPTVPSNIVNTITTTAGAHTAITSQKGNVSFNVPTTAAHVGAATSDHAHGNITNGGDITASAPTIASGDQIIINDNSASKVTNGPTFDGSTTTTALTPKGTWENFSKFSGSYNDLTNKPTIPSVAALLDVFYPVGTIYETTADPDTFNPNTAWGGEWTRIKDKFLLSAGDTYTGGSSGGSSDAVVPSHTHPVSITSKGMSANASHSHKASNTTDYPNFLYSGTSVQSGDMGSQSGSGRHYPFQSTTTAGKYWAQSTVTGSTSVAHTHNVTGDTGSTGVDTTTVKNTNMPPYLVVYVWKRIS